MKIFLKILTIISLIALCPLIVMGIVNLFCFVFKIGYTINYLQSLAIYFIMVLIRSIFKK